MGRVSKIRPLDPMADVGKDGVDDELFDFIGRQFDKIEYGENDYGKDPDEVKKRLVRERKENLKMKRTIERELSRMTPDERQAHDAKLQDMSNAFHYWTREQLSTEGGVSSAGADMKVFNEFHRNEWPSLKEQGQHTKWDVKARV